MQSPRGCRHRRHLNKVENRVFSTLVGMSLVTFLADWLVFLLRRRLLLWHA
jgi:ABC-type nitrate/sulfonate/bicarbonate transport system permease component